MEITLSNGKDHFYQWDTGQSIQVPEGVPTVHFKMHGEGVAFQVVDRMVAVPDELLQLKNDIILWTYDTNHTIDVARVPVKERDKPADYAYTPTEIKTWDSLDARITALESTNVQPNWDQNDDSAADYIRGRTHYVEAKHDVKIINQKSGEFTPELGLIVGNTYRVDYDSGNGFGVGSEFVCKDLNEGKDGMVPAPYVGNADGNGGPSPYLIFNSSIELHFAFDHMVTIVGWEIEGDFAAVKTLDLKYIDPGLLERIKALEDGGGVAGVTSVNGKTGAVELTAEDVGAATPEGVTSAVDAAAEKLQPKGDYITQDGLQNATNAALAQAKASGEFDGAPGAEGPQGPQGPAGAGLDVTGATVGQTVKIAAVDDNGVPTAWVPVDMADGGGMRWQTVNEITTSEQTNKIEITTDTAGVAIAEYHAVALKITYDIPIDDTQTSTNGQVWAYPYAPYYSTIWRIITTAAGWKTINRRLVNLFFGDSTTSMTVTGTGDYGLVPSAKEIESSPQALTGATLVINAANDHFPVGTKVSVAVLSERR